ncbi:SGNH/GDSL hydrolase family protein [Rhodococcus opacus]|uniref:SGNH/GDSL hydrolase family protein n=1 Tax=Rhodococcus opacus TaxID=37919 RepID=A0AAX3YJ69_RHOOP|nr:SGNH/GDSL hydrolase family protein [Rhodococcus opacus]MCZ4587526.1 SGNH/GDSL hydrolase family protein [Rhodococcus opacus]WLF49091.1 SGNH/GDSL hydrolase family protein [Rhodococcus opacus]
MKPRWDRWPTAAAVIALAAAVVLVVIGVAVAATRTTDEYASTYTPSPDATAAPIPTVDLARVKSVLFIGDSWTYGTNAQPVTRGFAYRAAELLGVNYEVYGFGSVGYINTGADRAGAFAERWAKVAPKTVPDLIVLEGSQNDLDFRGNISDAANSFISTLKGQFPQSQIVMMGPAPASEGLISALAPIDSTLYDVAYAQRVPYISPLTLSWFDASNLAQFIDPGNGSPYPNTEGHNFIAEHLVAELRALSTS